MKRASANLIAARPIHPAAMAWAAASILAILATAIGAPRIGDEPPIPKGYTSTDEVKNAIREGKVRLVNLFVPVPQDVEVTAGVEYGRVGERSLKLDLYRPRHRGPAVPGLILIHGGGWKSGTRDIYRIYCVRLA